MITFDEFQKVDVRTGRVRAATAHPDADRLLVLQVDLGELGERQVVAGIRSWYEPEALVGRTVLVVANLEPARLRGVESQGMVLAVKDGDGLRLVTTDGEVTPGRRVS